jgi:hypothetical protein
MNAKSLVLPSLCLGGAALLFAPLRPSAAFTKIGGSLGEGQRDVRVFDNFLDSNANNNVTPTTQFPGFLGAELAVWKGVVEWGAKLHGDGTGDPLSGNLLGNGAANFDAFWAGMASGIGTTNNNIVSSLADCGGGGTLAFTETPISDGWRIRYCDEWNWDDGPGTIGSRWDIQGVMSHEYGHALGLGHSATGTATMAPSGSPGQTSLRSIEADDIAGVQCVYGVAGGTKPMITATAANTMTNTITIYGMNFGATGNEVWFTNEAVTSTSVDPIVRVTSVSSSMSGTVISITIPAAAGPGDVLVNISGTGGATLSNAFPTDLVGTFGTPPGPHPDITSVTPSSIEALIPGTAETITIAGTDLDLTTSLLLDGSPIAATRWTIVDPNTITLDMPQANTLGAHNIGASDGVQTDNFAVTVIAPTTPKLEWGNGDPLNNVSRAVGLDMILAGEPGELHTLFSSPYGQPSFPSRYFYDALDRRITTSVVIPASGWIQVHIGDLPRLSLGNTWYGNSFHIQLPKPFPVSNDQSIVLLP